VTLVEDADRIAADAHTGQTRRHGAPYVSHPRAVARFVEDMAVACGLAIDDSTRATALLHDVLEDCPRYTAAILAERCGPAVSAAVADLTKTGKGEAATASYYGHLQKAASSTTKLVKVCDRLHNLAELHKQPDEKKVRSYVDETLHHVRPLAEAVHPGLVAAIDDAIANARANQGIETAAPTSGLYAIIAPSTSLPLRVQALLDGGVARLQLRVKNGLLDDRARLGLADDLHASCAARRLPFLLNDRTDLAFAAGCGVHLGDRDLPTAHARRLLGAHALVGTSTHSLQQLRAADDEAHADHIALGPIWLSTTKHTHPVVGVDALQQGCSTTVRPVVAIGGINTPARAAEAARAGAAFVAVVSALDPEDVDAIHCIARRFALSFAAASPRRRVS
jgi:thiamine-phosphate pyrophosphorylase